MSASNRTYAALFSLFVFFSICSFRLSCSAINNTISFCPEIEKHSLSRFKKSLEDPNNHLSSWDDEVNCCSWKGVSCNNSTGRIDGLRVEGLKGKINPSLFNLHHLKYLDLSNNDFSGETIPSIMGSLANLQYLNLSGSNFHGKIPHSLGNLSNLHTLDLEAAGSSLLHVDSLEWISRLWQLEYLNMNDVNLSKAENWAQVINSLPCLLELHLDRCSLDFMAPLDHTLNITTSLQHLFLSDNNLHYHNIFLADKNLHYHNIFLADKNVSYQHLYLADNYLSFKKLYVVDDYQSYFTIRPWIFQLTNLRYLDLSCNGFIGPIPTMSNATKLQHIDLCNNHLNSTIPDWLYLCKHLEFVDLSVNILNGTSHG